MNLKMYIWIGYDFADMQFDRQLNGMKQVLDGNATADHALNKLGYGDGAGVSWIGSDREICAEIFNIMHTKFGTSGFLDTRQSVIDVAESLGLFVKCPTPDDLLLTQGISEEEFEARINIIRLAQ